MPTFENGRAITCPDCGGDLQYQNRQSLVCLGCDGDFEHWKNTTTHHLVSVDVRTGSSEIVKSTPRNDREIRCDGGPGRQLVTDGGVPSLDGTERAPIVYLPNGRPVRVRLIGAECEGDVSGEGHYGYYPHDLEGEDPTVYFEGTPSVLCVHCGTEIAHEHIERHHTEEHPFDRWNPGYYPEVFDDAERSQDTDTEQEVDQ